MAEQYVSSFVEEDGHVYFQSGTARVEVGGLIAIAAQAANLVLAGPGSGADAAPTFRALVAADIPSLAFSSLRVYAAMHG